MHLTHLFHETPNYKAIWLDPLVDGLVCLHLENSTQVSLLLKGYG